MSRKKSCNHIVEYEQEQDIIDMLKAYKKVNAKAKIILYFGFWICVVILACVNVAKFMLASSYDDIKYIAAGVSIICGVISICLNTWSSKSQNKAARLLTQYETTLYEFPWKPNYGAEITPEEIYLIIKNDNDNKDYDTWFDHSLSKLKKPAPAILLCQRTCIMYDYERRRSFNKWFLFIASVAIFGSFALPVYIAEGIDWNCLLYISAFFPIDCWLVNSCINVNSNISTLKNLYTTNNILWDRAVKGQVVPLKDLNDLELLLFAYRNKQFLIPDILNKCLRKSLKKQNAYAVKVLVNEYIRSGANN